MPSRHKLSILLGIFSTTWPFLLFGQGQHRGPATPEERTRAVHVAQMLQADPLATDVQPEREWLIKWLIEVPDVNVKLCTTLLGDLGDSKSGYPGAIIATMMASQAALVIEHPDKAKDDRMVYLAGVEGALRAYQAIHAKNPDYRLAHLGSLIEMREHNKLSDYVRDTAKKCKGNG